MELTQDELTARLQAIRIHLVKGGLTDVTVEYPGYLSIVFGEREFHAGYNFEWDETHDYFTFTVYEFTDGASSEPLYLGNADTRSFEAIAQWVARSISQTMAGDK